MNRIFLAVALGAAVASGCARETPPAKRPAGFPAGWTVGLTTVAQPHDNLRLNADWQWKNLDANVGQSWYGAVTSIASTPANDQTYSAKWITDLSLSYRLGDQLTVTGGADNLFNVYPDRTIAANSNGGIFLYSGLSPFGYDGAFYYLRFSVGQ